MEREPRPAGEAHWKEPERMKEKSSLTRRVELDKLTPVYGTAQPPKGLSGLIRKLAYRTPEHDVRHWLALMMADKVEVWGARMKKLLRIGIPIIGIAYLLRRREASGLSKA